MVNILDPQYLSSELVGGLGITMVLLFMLFTYLSVKLKFNFQTYLIVMVFIIGTMGVIAFPNLIIVIAAVVGILAGIIFYSFLNKG